jgi:hypothetical protein
MFILKKPSLKWVLGGFFEVFLSGFFGGFFIANPDLLLILKVFDIIFLFAGKAYLIRHLLLFSSGPRVFLIPKLS